MRHEARQVPSWLIFDVGQNLKAFVLATSAFALIMLFWACVLIVAITGQASRISESFVAAPPAMKSAEASIAFGSAAAGALLGSLSAFYLGVLQQRRDKKQRDHVAILRTYYALSSQWNILEGLRKDFLEPYREVPKRFLKMPIFYSFDRHLPVPFDDLGFLATSDDPNRLHEILIAEQKFETVIGSLKMRNQKLEEFYRLPTTKVHEFDFESGSGRIEGEIRELFILKQSTEIIFETVEEALKKLSEEMQTVEEFTKRYFKDKRAITFTRS